MKSTNVSAIFVRIDRTDFTEYDLPQECSFVLPTASMTKIMKQIPNMASLLFVKRDGDDNLELQCKVGLKTLEYRIKYTFSDHEDFDWPGNEHACSIQIPVLNLKSSILQKETKNSTSTIGFGSNGTCLSVLLKDESFKGEAVFTPNEFNGTIVSGSCPNPIFILAKELDSVWALENINPNMRIHMDDKNRPIFFEFSFGNSSQVYVIIAPQIENPE